MFFILLKLEGKAPFKFLNLHKIKLKSIPTIIILAISIIFFSNIGLNDLLMNLSDKGTSSITQLYLGSILHLVFLAPLCEEIFFRGIIFTKLKKSLPLWLALIIQGFLFGILHGGPIRGFITMLDGIIFALVYNYTNNLTQSILLHSLVNLFLVILNSVPFDFNINPIISIVIGLSGFLLCTKLFFKIKESQNNLT